MQPVAARPPSKPSATERTVLAAAVCGALAVTAMVVFLASTMGTINGLMTAWGRERGQSLATVVNELGSSLATTTGDYAVWDEMWGFVTAPDPEWAASNLEWLVTNLGVSGVLVLTPDGKPLYEAGDFSQGLPTTRADAISYTVAQLESRPAAQVMLYEPSTRALYWLSASRVVHSDDTERTGESNGILLLARSVSAADVTYLQQVTGVTGVTIVHPQEGAMPTPPAGRQYSVPLASYIGPPGVLIGYDSEPPLLTSQIARWRAGTGLAIAVVLLAMAALLATFALVAMRPFRGLTAAATALAQGRPWQPPATPYREFETISGALTDAIERQKQAEQREHRRADELRLLLDSLPAHIFFKGPDGRYVAASQRFANLFRLTADELTGKSARDVMAPDSAASVERGDALAIESGKPVLTEEHVTVGDRAYVMEVTKAPVFDENGKITGLVGMAEDVTEQHELTEALRQSQKLDAVGQLAGGVAHDFNNVLTTVMSGVHLAMSQVPPDGQLARDLADVAQATSRAAQITRQLLFLSRSHAGEKMALDANEVVSSLGKMLHRLLGEDVTIDMALSPRTPRVLADRIRLEQVLLNLAINARDAMPRGGRLGICTEIVGPETIEAALANPAHTVAPTPNTGDLSAPGRGEFLLLSVTDTGTGIAPEDRARVFSLFFTTKQGRGTGLGLSVVQSVVEEHHGHLWFWSEPGTGSSFYVALPLTAQAPTAENPAGVSDRLPSGSETIMIVEDDDAVRLLTQRVLTRQGYQVVVAPSAAAALEMLAQMPQAPALLLSDVVMPGMSGFELANKLKELYPAMRVVLTSGYPGDAIAARGLDGETAMLLRKPYSAANLSRAIRDALDSPMRDTEGH